ncbi:MAG TPA: hypothetical protein VE912_18060 [Bacteroidales bacterium]|nr:hypothetical protein [Bacteroidales bacterium]
MKNVRVGLMTDPFDKSWVRKLYIVMGFIIALLSLFALIYKITQISFTGNKNDWSLIIGIVLGIVFILQGFKVFKRESKVFIAISDVGISFRLKFKQPVVNLSVSEINKVTSEPGKVEILTSEGKLQQIDYSNLPQDKINKLHQGFSEFQQLLDTHN